MPLGPSSRSWPRIPGSGCCWRGTGSCPLWWTTWAASGSHTESNLYPLCVTVLSLKFWHVVDMKFKLGLFGKGVLKFESLIVFDACSCIAEIQRVEHLIIKYTQFKVWQQPFSLTSFRKRVWMGRMTWTLYWWCIPTVTVRLHPCHFIQSRRLKSTWHSITTKRIPRVSSLQHIRPLLKEHFLIWYSVHLTKWLVLVLL